MIERPSFDPPIRMRLVWRVAGIVFSLACASMLVWACQRASPVNEKTPAPLPAPKLAATAPKSSKILAVIFPIQGFTYPDGAPLREIVEQTLREQVAAQPGTAVVDPAAILQLNTRLGALPVRQRQLLIGQITGAQTVIVSEMFPHHDGQWLRLTLIDTATSQALAHQACSVQDFQTIRSAVQQFLAARPSSAHKTFTADIALLPIHYADRAPDAEPDVHLTQRLGQMVVSGDNVRLLDGDLAALVDEQPRYIAAGLMDPPTGQQLIDNPVVVRGSVTCKLEGSPSFEATPYRLNFEVQRGTLKKTIAVAGTLGSAADLETQAANELRQAIAFMIDKPIPAIVTAEPEQRYWQARKMLFESRQALLKSWKSTPDNPWGFSAFRADPVEKRKATIAALQAADLIPDSSEPYEETKDILTDPMTLLLDNEKNSPAAEFRRRFIESFPDSPAWPECVESEILNETKGQSTTDKIGAANEAQAYHYSKLLADAIINGKCLPAFETHAALCTILRECQYDAAMDYSYAAMQSQTTGGAINFNACVQYMVDQDQLGAALAAGQAQEFFFPGLTLGWMNQNGRMGKLQQAAANDPRFASLVMLATEQQPSANWQQNASLGAMPAQPTDLVSPRKIEGLDFHALPRQGWIFEISGQGGQVWTVLRDVNDYYLWQVGSPQAVLITGMSPLYPIGGSGGHVMHPGIAVFQGSVYVATEGLGLYRIDPQNGQAVKVAQGLPQDAIVYSLAVEKDTLFAAGCSNLIGFVAQLGPGQDHWKVQESPQSWGAARLMVPRPGQSWRIYHDPGNRISEFAPASGQWREGWEASAYCFDGEFAASTGARDLLLEKSWSDGNEPLYMLNEADGKFNEIHCVPPDLTIFNPSMQRHAWFWQPPSPADMRVLPATGHPMDITACDGTFWILDSSGSLTATRDGQSFAGPFQVAEGGSFLCCTDDSLCIASGKGVVVVPLKTLRGLLQEPGAFRTSEAIFADVTQRLQKWIGSQPQLVRATYYTAIGRHDLAAAEYRAAGIGYSEETAVVLANSLGKAGQYTEALAALEPCTRVIANIKNPEVESQWLDLLEKAGQWYKLVNAVPELWRHGPQRGDSDYFTRIKSISAETRTRSYFVAYQHTHSSADYDKALWAAVRGQLPEVPWQWDENPVYASMAEGIRSTATEFLIWHLAEERNFDTIIDHPLLGEKIWRYTNSYYYWQWYADAGRYDDAVRTADLSDKVPALVEAGRFAEALQYDVAPDARAEYDSLQPHARAALYTQDWPHWDHDAVRLAAQNPAPRPDRLEMIRLMRQDPAAADAWTRAECLEYTRHFSAARQANADCMDKFPGTLAGAESELRLAELRWLEDGDEAAGKALAAKADAIFAQLAGSGDQKLQAFALLRRGMIALLFEKAPSAAKAFWTTAGKLDGPAAALARQALASTDNAELLAVGTRDAPAAGHVVEVALTETNWQMELTEQPRGKVAAEACWPLGHSASIFEIWADEGPPKTSSKELWYPLDHFRPGIAWVHVNVDGREDLVWCLLRAK